MNEEKKKKHPVIRFLLLAAVGFMVIPKLTNNISNEMYQRKDTTDEIDFENMGPDIVKREKGE